MSEHVLKKGECPICDASEFERLRAHAARLEERLGVVRGVLERLLEHHDATCLDHKAFGPCDLSEFRALAAALGEGEG